MNLVKDHNSMLYTVTRKYEKKDACEWLDEYIQEMALLADSKTLTTLAANQVGVSIQIFVGYYEGEWDAYFNPEVEGSHEVLVKLRCPHSGLYHILKRYRKIELTWQDKNGKVCKRNMVGMPAMEFQTAANYLNGIDFNKKTKLGDWGKDQERYA